MQLRPRHPDDAAPLAEVLLEVYAQDAYPAVWPRDPASWIAGDEPIAAWVAAEEDGRLAGHLSLKPMAAVGDWTAWPQALEVESGRIAVVSRFFVSPRHRGAGVGRSLLVAASAFAREHGFRLALDVAVQNEWAIAFYEHAGWRRVGEATLQVGEPRRPLPVLLYVEPG